MQATRDRVGQPGPRTFAGKFYFGLPDTGMRRYLFYDPSVSPYAPSLQDPAILQTPSMPVILYQQSDGSFLAAMAYPALDSDAVTVGYLSLPKLGSLAIDSAIANAVPIRIDPFGDAEVGVWNVLWAETEAWLEAYYTLDWYGDQGRLWCYLTPPPAGARQALQGVCHTPGCATLVSTKQGKKADLAYTDLSGVDFTGVDFTSANFTGAVLTGTIFHGAILTDATFTDAAIDKMDVTGATLDGAIFTGLDLSSVIWGDKIAAQNTHFENTNLAGLRFPAAANFSGAFFNDARLTGTVFQGAILTDATFNGATIDKMDVTGATLNGAVFAGLDVSPVIWGSEICAPGAHFERCLFKGCHFGKPAVTADFSKAFFNEASLPKVDLTGATLISATFYGANLTGAVLNSADFTQARLGGSSTEKPATLTFAVMGNVLLPGADLFGVNFVAVTLYGEKTQISNAATIEQADFSNAYLEGISFASSNLRGARFNGACLVGANFTNAKLGVSTGSSMSASFAGACLNGAIFNGADLAGVNLANASVSFANGRFPVRYCNERGAEPPLPATIPINCRPTTGLDLTALSQDTICPNGLTVADNQACGIALPDMLSAPAAPTQWCVASCPFRGGS